jgi:hypothetical protein
MTIWNRIGLTILLLAIMAILLDHASGYPSSPGQFSFAAISAIVGGTMLMFPWGKTNDE